jgi:hypothetical protein
MIIFAILSIFSFYLRNSFISTKSSKKSSQIIKFKCLLWSNYYTKDLNLSKIDSKSGLVTINCFINSAITLIYSNYE